MTTTSAYPRSSSAGRAEVVRHTKRSIRAATLAVALAIVATGCQATATMPADSPAAAASASSRPEWFGFEMTDVRTGDAFTIDDFTGKVVVVETMAQWCPTCREQQDEVLRMRDLLGNPPDLVLVSLDVDVNEDAASLKEYADLLGYDWHFAVAPLLVARALGNLYSAQYLNPPASPMLLIDRDGAVSGLPYGLKRAENLQATVTPLLDP